MHYTHTIKRRRARLDMLCFGAAAMLFSIAMIGCDGGGAIDGPIRISTEGDFDMIRANLGGNFILINDIDLAADRNDEFEPIAPDTDPTSSDYDGISFTGTFEGNGKTISNLRISKPRETYVGFFRSIGLEGQVRNLKLMLADTGGDNPSIEGSSSVGALAGQSAGRINNVGVERGTIKGQYATGGLVGAMIGGSITRSYATDDVMGGIRIGGLVGGMHGGSITKSYATGDVIGTGETNFGGLVGLIGIDSNIVIIEDSYATGAVKGDFNVGGLVARIADSATGSVTIKNSYATGRLMGDGSIGGLIGSIGTVSVTVMLSYFDATLTGETEGIGNDPGAAGIRTFYTRGTAPNQMVYTEETSGQLIQQIDFSWDFDETWQMDPGFWPTLQ